VSGPFLRPPRVTISWKLDISSTGGYVKPFLDSLAAPNCTAIMLSIILACSTSAGVIQTILRTVNVNPLKKCNSFETTDGNRISGASPVEFVYAAILGINLNRCSRKLAGPHDFTTLELIEKNLKYQFDHGLKDLDFGRIALQCWDIRHIDLIYKFGKYIIQIVRYNL